MKKILSVLLVWMLVLCCASALADAGRWVCPDCGTENDGNFCMECGAKRPEGIACPGCGAIYPEDTTVRFCMECGAKLLPDEPEPLAVDPELGRFATPEEAAQRYLDGLKARDLAMMLSATDWETLESHRTLDKVVARNGAYTPGNVPMFPHDGGLLTALNIEQMRAETTRIIQYSVLNFVALESADGISPRDVMKTALRVQPEAAEAFTALFDLNRAEALGRIEGVQFHAPEDVSSAYLADAQTTAEKTRALYGADEVCDLCASFMIDGGIYIVCPAFARYGDVWTMVSPGGRLAALSQIDIYHMGFTSINDLP